MWGSLTGKLVFLRKAGSDAMLGLLIWLVGPIVRIAPDEVSVSDPQAVHLIYGVKSSFRKTDFYDPFAPKNSSNGDLFTMRDEKLHTERRKMVNSMYNMVCASLGVVL